jgi:hypothetical protein
MKLELKHLAPYLPYELKYFFKGSVQEVRTLEPEDLGEVMLEWFNQSKKPILRPLSDLTEDYANFWNYSFRDFKWAIINKEVSVLCWHDLLSKHYDVFGLIEKGLAIDKKTIT